MTWKTVQPHAAGLPIAALVLATASVCAAPAWAQPADPRLQAFEDQLESHASATAVLQGWCDAHGQHGAKIVARRVLGEGKPPSEAARAALRLRPGQAVRYRRVELVCGDRVLSRADNWYMPARLTAAMNRALDTTQTPFGVVVAPLNFTRRNLETAFLTSGGEPSAVLRHSAVLDTEAGAPFSFVVETYTAQVLATEPAP